jgi:RNA polymerase sigma factor (TIGR02999 family)
VSDGGSGDVTRLLEKAREGDKEALARVFPLVYDELRRIASAKMRAQSPANTLQTTALVHEAYLRLMDREAPWESRAQFFGVASAAMRSILIDHARARKAEKRGGDRRREPLHDALAWFEENAIDLIALDEALDALEKEDPRKRRLVELRFFAGLSTEDASEVLGVSRATAERDWTLARAWLHRRMSA